MSAAQPHPGAFIDLKLCAEKGDLEGCISAISKGALINAQNSPFQLPLVEAIRVGDVGIVRLLVENGEVIFPAYHMDTAVTNRDKAMVAALIELSDLWNNEKGREYCTGCYFSRMGDTDVFKAALDSHPQPASLVNQLDLSWNTPLHTAVQKGDRHMVKFLLDHGARCDTTCLWSAASSSPEVLSLLIATGIDVNANGPFGQPALHAAASNGNLDACEALIAAGAKVDNRGQKGETALTCGAQHIEVVHCLLRHGANPLEESHAGDNALMRCLETDPTAFAAIASEFARLAPKAFSHRNKVGQTVLHKIAKHNFEGMDVSSFLSGGVGQLLINEPDEQGKTPLMFAAQARSKSIIMDLINAGANLDAQDINGFTPLMHAALIGSADACEILLMSGAKPNVLSKMQTTALDIAIRNDVQSAYPGLIAHGARTNLIDIHCLHPGKKIPIVMNDRPIVAAMKTGSLEFLQTHLQKNPVLDAEDIKAAKKYANRSRGKDDLASLLQSHLAQMAVNAMLDTVKARP